MRKIILALASAVAVAGCSHNLPRNSSFFSNPTPLIERSLAANTFTTATTGRVMYEEKSSRMTEGALLDGPVDFQFMLDHKHLEAGAALLRFSFNKIYYYCTQGNNDKKSPAGLSLGSFCLVDTKGNGKFDEIQELIFQTETTPLSFSKTSPIDPAPYHVAQVPFSSISMESDLVYEGIKDGYVVIEHRLHPVDDADVPYRRKFFVSVPQQNPVSLRVAIIPFEGMSVPATFNLPLLQPLMLDLVITKADDRSIQYSILKPWAPWRMPQGINQKGEFTTIPTTPTAPTAPAAPMPPTTTQAP